MLTKRNVVGSILGIALLFLVGGLMVKPAGAAGPPTSVTPLIVREEGVTQGFAKTLNCIGPLTTCSVTAGNATLRTQSNRAAVDATGSIVASVAQVLTSGIFTAATAVNVTLPTAQGVSGLVQGLPGAVVGDVIEIQLVANHATNAITLVAGTGSTIFAAATPTITNGSRIFRGRITSVAAGVETITWY